MAAMRLKAFLGDAERGGDRGGALKSRFLSDIDIGQ